MILFKRTTDLHKYLDAQRQTGKKIGFVPTMGALHDGHLSLIRQSKSITDLTVCSIFVNPTQFNDPRDFEKYPVTPDQDIALLVAAGCDLLFLPAVSEIYPEGLQPTMQYDLGRMETLLEGKFRPGHFQGVCQVVHRLLDSVMPGDLFLGQKDYQQCMVITRLIELIGYKEKTRVHICPTLRETDGLAMSSRNRRLGTTERAVAVTIYQALCFIREELRPGDLARLKEMARKQLASKGFRVDYLEIADAGRLDPCPSWDGKQKLVALAAAFLGEVRLIDNLPLN
ncbi:MAG: pantoate--beta-alanine ligase [Sphingobacteriales bacterium]|nr:pantoate--beta-alanine ligase [Sphingobacteriales bacterium]